MRQCDYVAVVYSVNDAKSVKSVKQWVEFVANNNSKAKLILVGNKCDLEVLDDSEIDKSAFCQVVKCSAKSGENVFEILNLAYDCGEEEAVKVIAEKKGGCC